jgi:hypothetical protein
LAAAAFSGGQSRLKAGCGQYCPASLHILAYDRRKDGSLIMLKANARLALFCLLALTFLPALAQAPAANELGWPREMDTAGMHFTIYQPQVDQWKKNRLEARAAVTVTRPGDAAPLYGIVSLTARTDVDKESRMVRLEDVKVTSVSFPAAKSQESKLEQAIRDGLPQFPHTVTLDRLLADMAMTQAEGETESVAVKNDPPKILYSATPTVLILIRRTTGPAQRAGHALPARRQHARHAALRYIRLALLSRR